MSDLLIEQREVDAAQQQAQGAELTWLLQQEYINQLTPNTP